MENIDLFEDNEELMIINSYLERIKTILEVKVKEEKESGNSIKKTYYEKMHSGIINLLMFIHNYKSLQFSKNTVQKMIDFIKDLKKFLLSINEEEVTFNEICNYLESQIILFDKMQKLSEKIVNDMKSTKFTIEQLEALNQIITDAQKQNTKKQYIK